MWNACREENSKKSSPRLISHLSGKYPARLSLAWRVYLALVVCGIYMASMNSERSAGTAGLRKRVARGKLRQLSVNDECPEGGPGTRGRYMYVLLGGELAGIKWQLPPQNAGWTMTYAAPRPAAERSPYSNAGQRIMLRACVANVARGRCFLSTRVGFNSLDLENFVDG